MAACGFFLTFILAQISGVIETFARPDSVWIMLFLAIMLIVLAVLLWMDKKLGRNNKAEE